MPNRKTFNERDRYDHSSHSTKDTEAGDLKSPAESSPKPDQPTVETGKMDSALPKKRDPRSH